MDNQEIKVTEVKDNSVVIEEKMTYEKNLGQLKNEVQELEYRKESLYFSMLQMKKEYQSCEERQKKLNGIIAKLKSEEKAQTVDEIFEGLSIKE